MTVPAQPAYPPDVPPPPTSSLEVTRLLSAGAYLQTRFRRQVVKELVEHDERVVAPSAGVDVATVLAHALRAGRLEYRAGCWTTLVWVLFLLVDVGVGAGAFGWMTDWSLAQAYGVRLTEKSLHIPGGVAGLLGDFTSLPVGQPEPGVGTWVSNYAIVSLLLWLVRVFSGNGTDVYSPKGVAEKRGTFLRQFLAPGIFLFSYWATALAAVWNNSANWVAVVFPLLLCLPVWRHHRSVEAVLCDRLSARAFEREPREEVNEPAWLRAIGSTIRQEQSSKLVLYDSDRPFVGLGSAMDPWTVVMDLERKPGTGPVTLTATEVLDGVKRKLADLARSLASAEIQDRFKDVRTDEVVYLPAGPQRNRVARGEAAVAGHLAASVGEGGEARRHFLRIQVGAWEQVVVSVLVRVHTTGEVLALEVVPHVLGSLRPRFDILDDIVERGRAYPVSSMAQVFLRAPGAGVAAVFSAVGGMVRTVTGAKRRRARRTGEARSEGAVRSVREIAARQDGSPLQMMDANRYLQTVRERIGAGVLQVLKEKGYEVGKLEQQVVQVTNGGIYITSMNGGAVASGRGASARGARGRESGSQPRRTLRRTPTTSRANR